MADAAASDGGGEARAEAGTGGSARRRAEAREGPCAGADRSGTHRGPCICRLPADHRDRCGGVGGGGADTRGDGEGLRYPCWSR